MLQEAEETDRTEDEEFGSSSGRELPEHLKQAEERKEKLKKAAELLKESKRERVIITEPESRVMKTRESAAPCYNLQAAVDSESQIIVGMDVVENEVDHGLLPEMIEKIEETVGLSADVYLADTGYCDEETLQYLESNEKEALMPPQKAKKENREALFCSASFIYEETRDVLICPAGRELPFRQIVKTENGTYRLYRAIGCKSCSFHKECVRGKASRVVRRSIVQHIREKMRERLGSEEGKELYKLRGQTVEPVFGQIKRNMSFDRLLLRGLKGAKAELALMCLVHNIRKCMSKFSRKPISAAA